MATAIQVTAADKRLFLDRVVAHGVDHEILTQERRMALANELIAMHPQLCPKFGVNPYDIGEALRMAGLVKQLLSLGLELAASGDVSRGAQLLQITTPSTIVLKEIAHIEELLAAFDRAMQSAVYMTQFGYGVCLFRANPPGHIFGGDVLTVRTHTPSLASLAEVVDVLKTVNDLHEFSQTIKRASRERWLSHYFLPWDQLKGEASFSPRRGIPNTELTWTADTLMATMTVTLVCGGTNRLQGGTILSCDALETVAQWLSDAARFRKRGREAFRDCIEQREEYRPSQYREKAPLTDKVMKDLMAMWERAMDRLFESRGASFKQFGLIAWSERLHLDAVAAKFEGAVKTRERCLSRPPGKRRPPKDPVERILGLPEDTSPASMSKYLQKLDLEIAVNHPRFSYLMRLVPGKLLLLRVERVTFTPKFVEAIMSYWSAYGVNWTSADKRRFVEIICAHAASDFWAACPSALAQALINAAPEKEAEIQKYLQWYTPSDKGR